MGEGTVPFVRHVPDYVIEGENIIVTVDGEPLCAFSIPTFERGCAKAQRTIARHYAKRAEVIPIDKGRRKH